MCSGFCDPVSLRGVATPIDEVPLPLMISQKRKASAWAHALLSVWVRSVDQRVCAIDHAVFHDDYLSEDFG